MQMYPEQIVKTLIAEIFQSRRLVVRIFVVVNAAMLIVGLLFPKGFSASTSILIDDRNIVQPLMQGAAVTTVGRNIIKIEYKDDDAERAFRTTQKMAELFMQESIAAKAAESSAAFDFIDKQTQDYHDKLVRTEEQLRELRSANLDARAGSEAEVTARMNDLQRRI